MSEQAFIVSGGNSLHLSNFASSYVHDPANYTAETVAPVFSTSNNLNYSFLKNAAGWSDLASTIRADGQKAAMLDGEANQLSQGTLDVHALSRFISDDYISLRGQANVSSDKVFESEVRRLTGALMINREKELADMVTKSGNYQSGNAGAVTTAWNAANSDPIADVLDAKSTVAKGPAKNSRFYMVADESVWLQLMGNAKVKEAVRGLAYGAGYENIGAVLGVIPVVCRATYADDQPMYGSNVVIFRRPEIVNPDDESAQCSFRMLCENEVPVRVRKWYDNDREGNMIECKANYKFIAPYTNKQGKFNTACLLTGVIS